MFLPQAADSENGFLVENSQHPPLNLGDPESGYLTESNLLSISLQIGQDWRVVGINLGLSYEELDRIQYKSRSVMFKFDVFWSIMIFKKRETCPVKHRQSRVLYMGITASDLRNTDL